MPEKSTWWVICAGCEELFLQRRVGQSTCGNRCTRNANRKALKARPHVEGGPVHPVVMRRFQHARGIARHHGRPWELSYDEYAALVSQACHYCGGELFRTGIGLDQLVPGQGYVLGNVVPCCWICNDVKSNVFTADEMRELGAVIARIRSAWPASRLKRGEPIR